MAITSNDPQFPIEGEFISIKPRVSRASDVRERAADWSQLPGLGGSKPERPPHPSYRGRPRGLRPWGPYTWSRATPFVYTLLERQARARLSERDETLLNYSMPSSLLTAHTVLQLMRNIALLTIVWARQLYRQVTTISPVQLHIIGRLGYEESIYALALCNSS